MKIDAVSRVSFAILQAAQFTEGCIASFSRAGDNRASQFFKTVFDFVFLGHVSGVQLVMMIFEGPV